MEAFKIYFEERLLLKSTTINAKIEKNADEIALAFQELKKGFLERTTQWEAEWNNGSRFNPKMLYPLCAEKLQFALARNIGYDIPCKYVDISPESDIEIEYTLDFFKIATERWEIQATLRSKEYMCLNIPTENVFVCEDLETHQIHFFKTLGGTLCLKSSKK